LRKKYNATARYIAPLSTYVKWSFLHKALAKVLFPHDE